MLHQGIFAEAFIGTSIHFDSVIKGSLASIQSLVLKLQYCLGRLESNVRRYACDGLLHFQNLPLAQSGRFDYLRFTCGSP